MLGLESTIPDGRRPDGEAENRASCSPVGAGTGVVVSTTYVFVKHSIHEDTSVY